MQPGQKKSDDYHHINVAELNAVPKRVNLGVKWGLKEKVIKTDCEQVVRFDPVGREEDQDLGGG